MNVPPPNQVIRALLIEDSAGYTYIIRDMLMRQTAGQFELHTADSLESGLKAIVGTEPQVVLLDLGLPESAGYATFQQVQAVNPDVPIIILTAVDDEALATRAVREGAQDFLVKERVDRDLLTRSIRYAIERQQVDRELRDLSGRLLKIQDEERRRIARELHDVTAQNLAALGMNLSLLQGLIQTQPERAREMVSDCRGVVDKCTQELRTLSYVLHAPLLDELGLAGAVRDYADGFSKRSRIRVDLEVPAEFPRLGAEQENALFRVLQEGLNNVHRHSGSPTASVRLEHSDLEIALVIEDAGRGLPSDLAPGDLASLTALGVGIQGMRERMRQLGGRLELTSLGRSGTRVRASLPKGSGER